MMNPSKCEAVPGGVPLVCTGYANISPRLTHRFRAQAVGLILHQPPGPTPPVLYNLPNGIKGRLTPQERTK